MKKFCLLSMLLLLTIMAVGCGSDDEEQAMDGDVPSDGDTTDGDEPEDGDDPEDGDTPEDGDLPEICRTDLAIGEKEEFASGFTGSEGIAFDGKGFMYVTTQDRVIRMDSEGNQEDVAVFTRPLGIAFDVDGNLVVADFGTETDADIYDGAVYRIDSFGNSETLDDERIANPNFVTRTPWGAWLISDDMTNEIWEMDDDGHLSLWTTQVPTPNGMVFSADGATLFVAETFQQNSPVHAIPVTDGVAGVSEVFVNLDSNSLNDGIGMDANGDLYVCANGNGKIIRVNKEGDNKETIASGLTLPASLAFGNGEGFDPCSIYVTELAGSKIWRIAVGVPGLALFK